ncbi:MAG: universal stress protein [Paramuribaculum sp.]|nr:universal stress protein [Paramuribaculum sp.]
MCSDRQITVAIHTYERALAIASLLEREGVKTSLQNVNLEHPTVSSGVRIRIYENDLPQALRIIENIDIFQNAHNDPDLDKASEILVPVDFSAHSKAACLLAFNFADSLNTEITLLHSYLSPKFIGALQLTDSLTYDVDGDIEQEALNRNARKNLHSYASILRTMIKTGDLPPVKFHEIVEEGVPEDAIRQYVKEHYPKLIVMGTRGADTKERELVGSVTAEVLDTCRVPVFTVPEGANSSFSTMKNILFFSNFDQEDLLAIDALHQLLPQKSLDITLVPIPSKKFTVTSISTIDGVLKYFMSKYPQYTFDVDKVRPGNIAEDYARIAKSRHIDFIAVPNKKKNALARMFNPGIAHRLLFHSDMPMLVIPV